MNVMPILLIVWGVVAVVLLVLLGYRGTLTRNEDDQIHLDEANKHHELEQSAILMKLQRIRPIVRATIGAQCLMTACIAGLFIWDVVQKLS
jgi:sensor domain CHASE-containing protein